MANPVVISSLNQTGNFNFPDRPIKKNLPLLWEIAQNQPIRLDRSVFQIVCNMHQLVGSLWVCCQDYWDLGKGSCTQQTVEHKILFR